MYTLELWNICIIDPCTIFCCNKKRGEKGALFNSFEAQPFLYFRLLCSIMAKHIFCCKGREMYKQETLSPLPICISPHVRRRARGKAPCSGKRLRACGRSALRLHHCLHRIAPGLGAGGTAAQERGDSCCSRPSCEAGGEIRARRRAEGEKPDLFFSHRRRVLRSNGNVGSQIAGSGSGPEAGKNHFWSRILHRKSRALAVSALTLHVSPVPLNNLQLNNFVHYL